jgi:YgiT-type zinc finger domain-containing protein
MTEERGQRHGCGGVLRSGYTYLYVHTSEGVHVRPVPCWWCEACGECLLERDTVNRLEAEGLLTALVTEWREANAPPVSVSQAAPIAAEGSSAADAHPATATSAVIQPS